MAKSGVRDSAAGGGILTNRSEGPITAFDAAAEALKFFDGRCTHTTYREDANECLECLTAFANRAHAAGEAQGHAEAAIQHGQARLAWRSRLGLKSTDQVVQENTALRTQIAALEQERDEWRRLMRRISGLTPA